ncbi:hypothetical protein [Saccharolobus caldissimus]|uniref:Uncharacterized protein n=1 Tax=Saccharolobus caldissimus TaxID=1702097 RepID=A0AAQ4CU76_9CREN|nr:hypothetical protein [Saccharolobus caldissimus]BDB99357.1 hypothetical protein SACC_23740 [Saccharolobus caldissimus]
MNPFKKEKIYPKQVDLNKLINEFSTYLQNNGWKVQQKVEGNKAIVQAQKGGILRDIIVADRALTFTFENTPQGLKVTAGIGKWLQNLAITAVEAILLSELFLVVDVPEMLWNTHIESELMKKVDQLVAAS